MKPTFSATAIYYFLFFIASVSCQKDIKSDNGRLSLVQSDMANVNETINIVLNTKVSNLILNELKNFGTVIKVFPEINALSISSQTSNLANIRRLAYVKNADVDSERRLIDDNVETIGDFSNGANLWNLDLINVTDSAVAGRTVDQDGSGVYIAFMDSGLPDFWRKYLPEERVAVQYARAFGGGGHDNPTAIPDQHNKWEHDQNSHGAHIASTLIGFLKDGVYYNGVAPKASIIPIKIANQNGYISSSVSTEGFLYVAGLKNTVLRNSPVIITVAYGGKDQSSIEKAALDYAIQKGVIIVAAAGGEFDDFGLSYPAAYPPVISASMFDWASRYNLGTDFFTFNVPDPTNADDYFFFGPLQKNGQDLDVVAPGVVMGPYEKTAHILYGFFRGSSISSAHVAGIIALMTQKKNSLTPAQVESILEAAAIPVGGGAKTVYFEFEGEIFPITFSWEAEQTGNGLITADAALALTN